MRSLVTVSRDLARAVDGLGFGPPVFNVYNPLQYAKGPHEAFLKKYGKGRGRVVLLGMNPGPFGMAQTGVPFGDPTMVREFLGISGKVGTPDSEHPKRPITGFDCPRNEVSGTRLWGWARDRFETSEAFFERFFVANYCPLVFLEEGGRNRTPDKLPAAERVPLFEVCDEALRRLVDAEKATRVIGIGKFAEDRVKAALDGKGLEIGRILHPSPASPAANRGWAEAVDKQLKAMGILR